jgi:uncharacterized protein YceK
MRITIITVLVILLAGCGTTGENVIRSINTASVLANTTEAGVREEIENCARDWFDTANRGSGCN